MNNTPNKSVDFTAALKFRDVQLFIGSVGCFTFASRALAVVIGFQIYKLTHSAMALGWLAGPDRSRSGNIAGPRWRLCRGPF